MTVAPLQSVRLGLTGREAVAQRVSVFLAMRRGTVPLDRQFGLPGDLLDAPSSRTAARLRAEVVAGLARYVPEVRVVSVEVLADADGRVEPRVTLAFV